MRRILYLIMCLLPLAAFAQSYPDYERITVNDYADLLSDTAESELDARLARLRDDTGVELTVLTLVTQEDYAPDDTLEKFATGLFNHWGIGDAERNDGILIMVLRDDRAMRIELGAGYGRDWDRTSAKVIDRSFLPAFRDDRYEDGILTGVEDTIQSIALPFNNGESEPFPVIDSDENSGGDTSSGGGNEGVWIMLASFITLFAIGLRRKLGDLIARFRTCPQCGQRGLRRRSETVMRPTKTSSGSGRATTTCQFCSYHHENTYRISRLSSSSSRSSSSFGGGSSGGGGASGRW